MGSQTRRAFVRRLGRVGAAVGAFAIVGGCTAPLPWSPPPGPRRIGLLDANSSADSDLTPFLQGLRDLGYVEGRPERLPDMAAELVRMPVDVLATVASPAALAAKHATTTIPIVFMLVSGPVELGLVDSLAQPGGNVTGLSTLTSTLSGKRVELIRAALPGLSRLTVLWNTTNPGMGLALAQTQDAARSFGLDVQALGVLPSDDLARAFDAATGAQAGALIVLNTIGRDAVDLAARYRLPAIYAERTYVDQGGLMGLGPNLASIRYRAASYVDKIFRGARPADLPVEQPSAFDFVVNLRAARELGLAIPEEVLLQATQVIQ
jgi:putative tryptophan/tyrosine transport system substrate-binding protein